MAKATVSSQRHYLKSDGRPQASVGFSLMQDLPVLLYFHFCICSSSKKNKQSQKTKGGGWVANSAVREAEEFTHCHGNIHILATAY